MIEGFRKLARGETSIDFIGRTKLWATVTATVLVICAGGLIFRQLNLGLEFKGGTSLQVPLKTVVAVAEVEEALSGFDLGDIEVQIQTRGTGEREALVRSKHIENRSDLTEVQAALAKVAGQVGANGEPLVDEVSITDVGPSWGRQVSNKALRGLLVFLVLVTIYITLRFELKMALGALAALFHDLIATAGVYALVGFEVTPATVIALLTLMGFSLYDTVVVFDRVHENAGMVGGTSRTTYSDMVNISMNQVLMRSINTSLSSVVPVAGLLFVGVFLFGAVTLKDLALAMFVGTMVSTYSSIFVAAPILAWLKEREPRYRAVRAKAAPVRAPTPVLESPAAGEASTPAGVPLRVGRPPPRPRKRRRGKRR